MAFTFSSNKLYLCDNKEAVSKKVLQGTRLWSLKMLAQQSEESVSNLVKLPGLQTGVTDYHIYSYLCSLDN